jgi:hypothetical protein
MSKFKLKESTVVVRDEKVRVRELTHGERLQWIRGTTDDRFRGPALLLSFATLEPKFTEEEVGELPADVVTAVSSEILKLSGMVEAKKEPNARGDVPVPPLSGDGSASK